jgi:hypothetical protein
LQGMKVIVEVGSASVWQTTFDSRFVKFGLA